MDTLQKNFLKNQYVQAVLNGIKPCIIGIIVATGLHMIIVNAIANGIHISKNWQTLVIMAVIFIAMLIYKKIKKKAISPIMLIAVSALSGIVIYGI